MNKHRMPKTTQILLLLLMMFSHLEASSPTTKPHIQKGKPLSPQSHTSSSKKQQLPKKVTKQGALNKVASSMKSDLKEHTLETKKDDSMYTIKSKQFKPWIVNISKAETYKTFSKNLKKFENMKKKFMKKYPSCLVPPAPKFHKVYKNKHAMTCQNGFESGKRKGERYAKNFNKSKDKKYDLAILLKSLPVNTSSIYSMCRVQGAKVGYKDMSKVLNTPRGMVNN